MHRKLTFYSGPMRRNQLINKVDIIVKHTRHQTVIKVKTQMALVLLLSSCELLSISVGPTSIKNK